MEQLFIVIGNTGEYSDQYEWPVMAYFNEALARAHVEAATRRANEIQAAQESIYDEVPEGVVNEHDPDMKMDYTGTTYYLWTVPLADRKDS